MTGTKKRTTKPMAKPHQLTSPEDDSGNGRAARKEATRQRILVVAKSRFLEVGFQQVTTREIAELSGVAAGTVFAHFADKHVLLRAVLSDDIAKVVVEAQQQIPDNCGWRDAALTYARALYTFHAQQHQLSIALLKELVFDSAYLDDQTAAMTSALASRLPAGSAARRHALAESVMANYLQILLQGLSSETHSPAQWVERLGQRLALLPD
jgi:AcrR family transcriptional regulator